jgi:hypothetical protein
MVVIIKILCYLSVEMLYLVLLILMVCMPRFGVRRTCKSVEQRRQAYSAQSSCSVPPLGGGYHAIHEVTVSAARKHAKESVFRFFSFQSCWSCSFLAIFHLCYYAIATDPLVLRVTVLFTFLYT